MARSRDRSREGSLVPLNPGKEDETRAVRSMASEASCLGLPENVCPSCFTRRTPGEPCVRCVEGIRGGSQIFIPIGAVLRGEFVIGRPLGKPGGFAVTYLAWDRTLEEAVAIKEYMPRDLAGRQADHLSVRPHSPLDEEPFRWGIDQFLQEARTLARIRHPNVVRVRRFFEANGTAYLVMDYYEGLSLEQYLEEEGLLPEREAIDLIIPVLDGLHKIHAAGILHRDIKPANIHLADRQVPILLDFGAARQALGERTKSLSIILTPGFAPFEQYHNRGRQGPWTDIYSVAATLYQMITGAIPPEATERMAGEILESPECRVEGLSPTLCEQIMAALALDWHERPQDAGEFREALLDIQKEAAEAKPVLPVSSSRQTWIISIVVVGLATLLIIPLYWHQKELVRYQGYYDKGIQLMDSRTGLING